MTSATRTAPTPQWQSDFLQRHRLDATYLETAQEWFAPLVSTLATHQNSADSPVLIALNGCQGSGKTTLSDFLCTSLAAEFNLQALALSLDDFYLTGAQRAALARSIHPLLATRGVPGTHDMALLRHSLEQLLDPHRCEPVAIPRFDKSVDDRRPASDWDRITSPVHVVILEGWCLGALPQAPELLSLPLNELERNEDSSAKWRTYSNASLADEFQPLYTLVDQWIMLRAPSFECVFEWRREQESKLAATIAPGQANKLMDDQALRRFIQHYERLTRQCLAELPDRVDHLFKLNEQRQVTAYRHHQQLAALS